MGVIITAKIEDVRDMCRAGQWRAYTKGRDIYLENCITGGTVWLNERTEEQAAPRGGARVADEMTEYTPEAAAAAAALAGRRRETPHGGRTARMFGTDQPKPIFHGDEGPFRGFLMVKCESCGKIRAFCAKRETYGFRCDDCGETTPLENMRPMYLKCKCGAEFRYKTNLTEKYITHPCVSCGAPVDMMLNSRETAYVTIGEKGQRK